MQIRLAGLSVIVVVVQSLATAASAESLDEALNMVLLGSNKDRLGLVSVIDPQQCVVKLENRGGPDFAIIRFSGLGPESAAVVESGGRHIQLNGGTAFLDLHQAGAGPLIRSGSAQITTTDPDREMAALKTLAQLCPGTPAT